MEPMFVKADGDSIGAFDPHVWNRELSLELNHELKDLEEVYSCAWMPLDPDLEQTEHPIFASAGKGGLRVWKEDEGQFVITVRIVFISPSPLSPSPLPNLYRRGVLLVAERCKSLRCTIVGEHDERIRLYRVSCC